MISLCVKQSCGQEGNLLLKESEVLGKLKQTLSKVFQSAVLSKGMCFKFVLGFGTWSFAVIPTLCLSEKFCDLQFCVYAGMMLWMKFVSKSACATQSVMCCRVK